MTPSMSVMPKSRTVWPSVSAMTTFASARGRSAESVIDTSNLNISANRVRSAEALTKWSRVELWIIFPRQ